MSCACITSNMRGAVFLVRLVAGGKQAGGRGVGDLFEVVGGLAGEIEEVLPDDSADAVDRPVNGGHLAELAGFQRDAHDALVDHVGGAATLGDEDFSFESAHAPRRIGDPPGHASLERPMTLQGFFLASRSVRWKFPAMPTVLSGPAEALKPTGGNPPCPWLPRVDEVHNFTLTRRHGTNRGADFYRDALRFAQSQWMSGKPAQAVLQLDKAWMADLAGGGSGARKRAGSISGARLDPGAGRLWRTRISWQPDAPFPAPCEPHERSPGGNQELAGVAVFPPCGAHAAPAGVSARWPADRARRPVDSERTPRARRSRGIGLAGRGRPCAAQPAAVGSGLFFRRFWRQPSAFCGV